MSNRTYSFFFLTGALAFSVSSLPGNHVAEVRSVELRSEKSEVVPFEECDPRGKLLHDSKGRCEEVSADIDKEIKGSMSFEKHAKDNNMVTVTVELEGRFCLQGKCKVVQTVQADKMVEFTKATMNKLAEPLKAQKAKDAELARAKENCEKDERGEKIEGKTEVLECRAKQLIFVTDEEEANKFYRKNIENQLIQALNSPFADEREKARALVDQLGHDYGVKCSQQEVPTTMTDSPFVSVMDVSFKAPDREAMYGRKFIDDSVCMMGSFKNYQTTQENVASKVAYFRATGTRPDLVEGWEGMAKSQRLTWGEYYKRRGFQLNHPHYGFAGPVLRRDLDVLNNSYLARHAEILNAYRGLLNPGSVKVKPAKVQPVASAVPFTGVNPVNGSDSAARATEYANAFYAQTTPAVASKPAVPVPAARTGGIPNKHLRRR